MLFLFVSTSQEMKVSVADIGWGTNDQLIIVNLSQWETTSIYIFIHMWFCSICWLFLCGVHFGNIRIRLGCFKVFNIFRLFEIQHRQLFALESKGCLLRSARCEVGGDEMTQCKRQQHFLLHWKRESFEAHSERLLCGGAAWSMVSWDGFKRSYTELMKTFASM